VSVPNLSSLQPAVFDSGPLIYLDSLGYAELLPELNRVLAPPAVLRELAARPDEPGGRLPGRIWLERKVPKPEYVNRVGQEPPTLGEGEKETIALALQLGALAVLDDLRARRRARLLGVGLTGTLGVLLRLHRPGQRSHLRPRESGRSRDVLFRSGTRRGPQSKRRLSTAES